MRDRERLITRIRQMRRTAEGAGEPGKADRVQPEQDYLHALEARVEHLEQMVQGLQDSVHRESSRQAKRIAELEGRIQPAELSRALSEDARERGL